MIESIMVHQNISLKRQLVRYRSIWFKKKMDETMRNHKQSIVLVVLFFPFLPGLVILPLWEICRTSDSNVIETLLSLLALVVFALGWVYVNKQSITGGSFRHYLDTLPIPKSVNWYASMRVILFSDFLLGFVFLMGFSFAPYGEMGTSEIIAFILRMVNLMLFLLLLQTAFVNSKVLTAFFLIVGLLSFVLLGFSHSYFVSVMLFVLASTLIAIVIGKATSVLLLERYIDGKGFTG